MKSRLLLFLLTFFCIAAFAQENAASHYGDRITVDALKENLTILSSDALEGRETGKRGQKMAAAFIQAHFEEIGLSGPVNGGYVQSVLLYAPAPGKTYIKSGGESFENFKDIVYYGRGDTGGEITAPAVFGGAGRKEDLDQLEIDGRIVVLNIKKEASFRELLSLARERNAKMVFFYYEDDESFNEMKGQLKSYASGRRLSLKKPEPATESGGAFIVSSAVAAKILNTTKEKLKAASTDSSKKQLKKIKAANVSYRAEIVIKTVKSENVLGYLEGTDKKDELIVITAHYDHIGKKMSGAGDLINNGADDDGSGTVGVMEIARAFAEASQHGKGPRRSILFMTVTGEEKGLLGSEYYSQNPVFPLEKTMVNLNIDMVGRRDPQHEGSSPYVYVIGSDKLSSQLHTLSESVNQDNHKLIFDYTYNDQNHPERLYYRSDHWNFAKNNIPIIFYFDGIHEDYHKPSDEVDKIEFDLLQKRIQTIFFTAWELANREEPVKPDTNEK